MGQGHGRGADLEQGLGCADQEWTCCSWTSDERRPEELHIFAIFSPTAIRSFNVTQQRPEPLERWRAAALFRNGAATKSRNERAPDEGVEWLIGSARAPGTPSSCRERVRSQLNRDHIETSAQVAFAACRTWCGTDEKAVAVISTLGTRGGGLDELNLRAAKKENGVMLSDSGTLKFPPPGSSASDEGATGRAVACTCRVVAGSDSALHERSDMEALVVRAIARPAGPARTMTSL